MVLLHRRAGLLAVACAAALLTACTASAQPRVVATDRCGPLELQEVQGGSHLLGDQPPPVPYSSTPPTSGWHTSEPVAVDAYDRPLTEPQQVSVLETGAAMVTYGLLPDDEVAQLAEYARAQQPGRVAVAPYERLAPGEVVFAVWGALQRCEGVDLDALDVFVEAHAAPQPASPAGH